MDCLTSILSFFNLIISKLNDYSGLLIAALTIIGFIYIRKQISIAKNKDILSDFQKEISQFMYDRHKQQSLCHNDFVKVIGDCLKIKDYDSAKEEKEKKNEAIEEEMKYLFEKYGSTEIDQIINKVLNPYRYEITNANILSTAYYKWWLQNDYNDFKKLIDSDYSQKTFYYYNMYFDIIKNTVKGNRILPMMDVPDKLALNSSINNELQKEVKKYYDDYNSLSSEIDKFLIKLAKTKGVL